MDTIKIFVGSEPGNEKAEQVLEWSIKNTTSGPYELTWMSDAIPGIWQGWNKGRPDRTQNTLIGWKTNFSCFRWAIPELCEFKGRAIYLDVDQILLKDIRQMWELPMDGCSYLSIRPERTDVMLMDCSLFAGPWWYSIDKMKPSGKSQRHYRKVVEANTKVGKLDGIYNCLDGDGFTIDTRLLHYTEMTTQPWHPFPETIKYVKHKNPALHNLWHDAYLRSCADLKDCQVGVQS